MATLTAGVERQQRLVSVDEPERCDMSTENRADFGGKHEAEKLQATSQSASRTDKTVRIRRNHRIANAERSAGPTTTALPKEPYGLGNVPKPPRHSDALVVAQHINAMEQSMVCTGGRALRKLKRLRCADAGTRSEQQKAQKNVARMVVQRCTCLKSSQFRKA
ncbi:MAG: hypothetical protein AAFR70_10755 [Pseudomonadota bacterium]